MPNEQIQELENRVSKLEQELADSLKREQEFQNSSKRSFQKLLNSVSVLQQKAGVPVLRQLP